MFAPSLVAAVVLTWVPGAAYDTTCTLGRVDRSTTSSETCLSCHDGSSGPAIALHQGGTQGTHSVGVAYAEAREYASLRRYGPANARIVLPRGRVECVTCHASDGAGPHWTVASINLCADCHDK